MHITSRAINIKSHNSTRSRDSLGLGEGGGESKGQEGQEKEGIHGGEMERRREERTREGQKSKSVAVRADGGFKKRRIFARKEKRGFDFVRSMGGCSKGGN